MQLYLRNKTREFTQPIRRQLQSVEDVAISCKNSFPPKPSWNNLQWIVWSWTVCQNDLVKYWLSMWIFLAKVIDYGYDVVHSLHLLLVFLVQRCLRFADTSVLAFLKLLVVLGFLLLGYDIWKILHNKSTKLTINYNKTRSSDLLCPNRNQIPMRYQVKVCHCYPSYSALVYTQIKPDFYDTS